MTRSLISFDEGFVSGVRDGVRWSKTAIQALRAEHAARRLSTSGLPRGARRRADIAWEVLGAALERLEAAPVDGPYRLPGAEASKPVPTCLACGHGGDLVRGLCHDLVACQAREREQAAPGGHRKAVRR